MQDFNSASGPTQAFGDSDVLGSKNVSERGPEVFYLWKDQMRFLDIRGKNLGDTELEHGLISRIII